MVKSRYLGARLVIAAPRILSLPDQGDDQRRRGDQLDEHQVEHGERHQDADRVGELVLARGDVENKHRQNGWARN